MHSRRYPVLAVASATALVAAATATAAAAAAPTTAATAARPVAAAPAAATWTITPSVDPVATDNELTAVSARTGSDAWAVGFYTGPARHNGRIMLAERWNGRQWSQVATPNVQFFDEKLLAVAATGPNDAWAVGSTNQTGFATTNPLTAHWDGTAWTIVSTPATSGGAKSILDGVAALSPTNVWAVGRSRSGQPLIEHSDGTAWSTVAAQLPANGTLTGISALAANDIWAVGSYSTVTGTAVDTFTLTVHFDGTSWTVVPSPNPAPRSRLNGAQQVLNGVAMIGGKDVWAVGNTIDTASGSFLPDKALSLHWDGRAWAVVPTPDGPAEDVLSGVSGSSTGNVWAVGQTVDRTGTVPVAKSRTLNWNGTAWSVVPSPSVGPSDTILAGVSTVPGGTESWAVGFDLAGASAGRTFVLHHG